MSQQEDERHYEYKQLVVQVTDVMLKILKKQNKMKQKKTGKNLLKKRLESFGWYFVSLVYLILK